MGAIPEEGQQVGPVVLCVEADLSLVVPLALVVVTLEQLMEVLQGKEVGGGTGILGRVGGIDLYFSVFVFAVSHSGYQHL